MRGELGRLLKDERAQDLGEYGVALAIIGVGAGAVALAFANGVSTVWASANAAIQNAANLVTGS